ncbi:MAG: DUF1080 domain-containing protein [Bacillota bacterium]
MRLICLAASVLLLANLCLAEDSSAANSEEKYVTLFDGKSLKGWKVIGCEAEVQDGAILIKAGNGVVRPDQKFKDFVFELDWKALKADNWDSGVYFRCEDPIKGDPWPWPKKYQANLKKGLEGNVDELKGARSKGLCKDGEWNHMKLTVIGTKAEMEINGKPAWKAEGVETPVGYISLQAEVPGGGQYLFRNIRVLEINKAEKE